MSTRKPLQSEIDAELGSASAIWHELVRKVTDRHAPIVEEWMPSKDGFGSMCRLKRGKRTLLYMTPQPGSVKVALVLGERSVALAYLSDISEPIKTLIRDARPYAEGRGIRFTVGSPGEIQAVLELLDIKLAPK